MALEDDIRAERVDAVFQQTPVTIAVSIINAALMAAMLANVAHVDRAYHWLGVVSSVAACRLGLWRLYLRAMARHRQSRMWGKVSAGGALAAGLAWGGGALLLFPASETYQLFWAFLLGGMCAGAAALHSAHLPTALAYIIPASLPLAAKFASQDTPHSLTAAAMIVVFVAALTNTSRLSNRQFGDMFRLQFELARRTMELDDINDQLIREMKDHRVTESTLRQAQKMDAIGQLTGGIAHDFNHLLTIILGSLEPLYRHLPEGNVPARRLLDNAVSGARKGAALTQRLLAFGRRQALKPEPVDVRELVRGLDDLLRSSVGAEIRIRTQFPLTLAPAYVDANQLELAVLNLVVNARDAMPTGGELTIAGREQQVRPGDKMDLPPGAYILVRVADTGQGMDEATLKRATEPFFTTKAVGDGTGLGLSMVHGLAAQSGGRLVLSSRKGAGTTAELWLPRSEIAEIAVTSVGPEPIRPFRPCTILVVDDDALMLSTTSAMLEELGHTATTASSGEEALEALKTDRTTELVITDYAMLDMTGVELAVQARRLRPDLAVILTTGYAELPEHTPRDLVRLPKPYDMHALAQIIADTLRQQATT